MKVDLATAPISSRNFKQYYNLQNASDIETYKLERIKYSL
jgi:hypothetical protein